MSGPESVVTLREVTRTFPSSPPVEALKSVDLDILRGEYVSIVGASGSGKSTLMHVLGCLDTPSSGSYHLEGVDVAELSDPERTGLRGRRIGFVFQSFHLMRHRTVRENVEAAGLYIGASRRERRELAEQALHQVGLDHRIDFTPRTLSGGECQRVAIARALLAGPALLLADEPTGNLDSVTSASVLDLFDRLRAAHDLTLVVVTHDHDVSVRADRVLRMSDGWLTEAAVA